MGNVPRLPGGEIIGQTLRLQPDQLVIGELALRALATIESSASQRALEAMADSSNGYYNFEKGRRTDLILVPQTGVKLARQIRHWPAGEPRTVESDQPLKVRILYPPTKTRAEWRLASAIEPSPDYRFQVLDFDPQELQAAGHEFAVIPWSPVRI